MAVEEREILIQVDGDSEHTICCAFNRYHYTHRYSEPIIWDCVFDPNRTIDYMDYDHNNLHKSAPYIEPSCADCSTREFRKGTVILRKDCIYCAWKGWMIDPPFKPEELMEKLGTLRLVTVSHRKA